ncbi:MAG: hypothetical protein HQM16_12755 [Deltaproteobacteria bacterium]|nr:hypothetical protein [Deltaproteobacteria bacterium]
MKIALPTSVDEMQDILDIEGIFFSRAPDVIRGVLMALLALVAVVCVLFLVKKLARMIGRQRHLTPAERAIRGLAGLGKKYLNPHKAECIAIKHEGFHVWRYAPDPTRADTMQKLMPKRVEKTYLGFKGSGVEPLFYFALDEIFRRYLFEQFALNVMDKTYEQLKGDQGLFSGLFAAEHAVYLTAYLDRAQMAKFAKVAVDIKAAGEDFKFVEAFVLKTRPQLKDGKKRKTK